MYIDVCIYICIYRSPDIVKMVRFWKVRLPRRVARMGKTRNAYRILVGNFLKNINFEDREGGGRIILNLLLEK
jgi:hypothetical protein